MTKTKGSKAGMKHRGATIHNMQPKGTNGLKPSSAPVAQAQGIAKPGIHFPGR